MSVYTDTMCRSARLRVYPVLDFRCEYCASTVKSDRCDSCGAPFRMKIPKMEPLRPRPDYEPVYVTSSGTLHNERGIAIIAAQYP